MIKNIVFDFGGVIVDIDRDKAVQAFIKLGLTDADSRLDKYHQTGIFQELEEGKLSADEFRKQLGDLCGRELTMEETKQAWLGFFNEVDCANLIICWNYGSLIMYIFLVIPILLSCHGLVAPNFPQGRSH